MKLLKRTIMSLALTTSILIQATAFAGQDQCLAYTTSTDHGVFKGYDVHCVGTPDFSIAEKFQGRTKTLKRLVEKMSQLGFEQVQKFKDGEVYFLPKGQSTFEGYFLAKGIAKTSNHYNLDISEGIQVFANTQSDLKLVTAAFNLTFAWKFSNPRKNDVYVIYKKSAN